MNRPEASQDDLRFVAQTRRGFTQFIAQFVQIMTTQVLHLNLFQIAPDAFIGVQVRGVGGQLFQMKTLSGALPQEIFDRLTAMSRQSIPDKEQFAAHMMQQMFQKTDNRRPGESHLLDHHEQAAIGGDGADDRQMIPSQGHTQDRCLPAGSIGVDGGGQQVKTRFIDKHYSSPFLFGFFFNSSHVSLRQRSIAASSRWLACSSGFCRLQPILDSNCPICDSPYVTPKRRWMTAATRARVHTSPRNPQCSAPWASKAGSCCTCSAFKRGLGPPPLRLRSASTPSVFAFLSHWLTAPLLTPSASAISFCFQPFCFSSQARNRRASRQSFGWFVFFLSIQSVYTNLTFLFRMLSPDQ